MVKKSFCKLFRRLAAVIMIAAMLLPSALVFSKEEGQALAEVPGEEGIVAVEQDPEEEEGEAVETDAEVGDGVSEEDGITEDLLNEDIIIETKSNGEEIAEAGGWSIPEAVEDNSEEEVYIERIEGGIDSEEAFEGYVD